jgi:hypothetical protein
MKFSGKNADRLLFLTLIMIGMTAVYVVFS